MRERQYARTGCNVYEMPLYNQAGNSIAVPIFESIFRKILLGETRKAEFELIKLGV